MGFKNLTKSLTNFLDVLANSKKIKFDEINKISFSLKNYSIEKEITINVIEKQDKLVEV